LTLDEVKSIFIERGFKFVEKRNSGDYTMHFWRDSNVLIVLEEAHRFNLTSGVNMAYIYSWFNPNGLDEDRLKAFDNYARKFNLSGFTKPWADGHYSSSLHPMHGIKNLLNAIAALQEFNPEKGKTIIWDEGAVSRLEYLID
jgi:hypothetical protein